MNSTNLMVLIGAGASHGCVDDSGAYLDEWQPPLVRNIFDHRPTTHHILKTYPTVAALVPGIRARLKHDESIEDILREYAEERDAVLRRAAWPIPMFLQELFGEISCHHPADLGTLFNVLAREVQRSTFETVTYVTTNYDTLLDRALEQIYSQAFNTLDYYCQPARRWGLIKLHGSVTWGKLIENPCSVNQSEIVIRGDELKLGPIEILSGHRIRDRVRHDRYFYPALSAPTAGKERFFNCPDDHLAFFEERLKACTTLLIIGFSGLDPHIVEMITRTAAPHRIAIVNGGKEAGSKTLELFVNASRGHWGPYVPNDLVYDTGFGGFVARDLRGFLSVPS